MPDSIKYFGYVQKYTSHLKRCTIDGRWTKHHGLLKEVDIQRDLMV